MSNLPIELKELLLAPPRRTVAVAESLTGGRVQALITGVAGASGYFLGGVTAYTVEQKVALLGVRREQAEVLQGVSEQVAGEMAVGACQVFGADVAVATTGYAEPAPAQGVSVPFAWLAVAVRGNGALRVALCRRVEWPGAVRSEAQAAAAEAALAALVEVLRAETRA